MAPLDPRRAEINYEIIEAKSALNPVKGMGFNWSLNPYVGCEHRCAFCYVRAYELRADRPFDDRYGRTIRVKANVAAVLRCERVRRGGRGGEVGEERGGGGGGGAGPVPPGGGAIKPPPPVPGGPARFFQPG